MTEQKMQTLKCVDDRDDQKDLDVIKPGMNIKEDLSEASEGHKDRNIPPFNASATTPQEAYPLNKIISTGEWRFVQNKHDILHCNSAFSEGGSELPCFVRNRINKLE